jgi:hypothetical protein
MKTNFVIFLSAIVIAFDACSQKFNIVKADAFNRNSIAGTIAVDENNRARSSGVTATHLIFVETKSNQPAPQWDTVWIDEKAYLVQPVEITQPELRLGKTKDTNREVVLKANAGNKLWQLMITSQGAVTPKPAKKLKGAVVLTGKFNQKPFMYSIEQEQPLKTDFNQ